VYKTAKERKYHFGELAIQSRILKIVLKITSWEEGAKI
jgi:hypothetical protein